MKETDKKELEKGSMLSEVCFPNIAMMYSNAGLDFTIIDCEHGAFDYSQVAAAVTAFRLSGVRAIVRIPEIRREPVTKYLDMGADGLLAPMVKDSADAARLVGFGKYPPVGNRGLSINRAHSRYSPGDLDAYLARANRRVRIYAQIELLSALEDAENIAAMDVLTAFLSVRPIFPWRSEYSISWIRPFCSMLAAVLRRQPPKPERYQAL